MKKKMPKQKKSSTLLWIDSIVGCDEREAERRFFPPSFKATRCIFPTPGKALNNRNSSDISFLSPVCDALAMGDERMKNKESSKG